MLARRRGDDGLSPTRFTGGPHDRRRPSPRPPPPFPPRTSVPGAPSSGCGSASRSTSAPGRGRRAPRPCRTSSSPSEPPPDGQQEGRLPRPPHRLGHLAVLVAIDDELIDLARRDSGSDHAAGERPVVGFSVETSTGSYWKNPQPAWVNGELQGVVAVLRGDLLSQSSSPPSPKRIRSARSNLEPPLLGRRDKGLGVIRRTRHRHRDRDPATAWQVRRRRPSFRAPLDHPALIPVLGIGPATCG